MTRFFATLSIFLSFSLFMGCEGSTGKTKKHPTIKATLKSVDVARDVLTVKQKVNSEYVDRELIFRADSEFVYPVPDGTKAAFGKAGLQLLEAQVGSPVHIKCDKENHVLKVTLKTKKDF